MSSTTTFASFTIPASAPSAARAVLHAMKRLQHGTLDVHLPDGSSLRFGQPEGGGSRAAIRLANWNVCAATLRSGDIGFAEGYIAGDWTTPDLTALIELFIANRDDIESLVYGTWWGSLLYRARHALRRNSRGGSQKNIHAHYDLGNAFYRLWLDPSMNYSSAWFDGDLAQPSQAAQQAKVSRVADQCRIAPGDRVLEIGCGWGAFAECVAGERSATVVGVTLSGEQLQFAKRRLADAGLAADLRFQDYRDIADGPFDAIASIEMFEAVGRAWWPTYFAQVRRLLKPGGRACIQSIVIRDDLFERYARSTDFIQQYVFPGGLLPSASAFVEAASAAGLRVVDTLDFGRDYAETLRRWRVDFLQREGAVRRLGFDTRFMRIWEFYLAYCEAAFAKGNTSVMQFTLE